MSQKSVKQNGIQNFLSQCLDFFHMLNTSNVKLNHFAIFSKIKLHRLTTLNMRLIAMTRILLQRLLWYTWKYYEWWNTWPHFDVKLYTKYVVLRLNSQGTLKSTVHNMPSVIHQPTENLVLTTFKKEGLKLPLNVFYILDIQYHMCITQQHTSYIKVVRWNFTVTIQGLE